jgi:hypothetical protein
MRPVVIYSNSPTAGTGYGQQCAQLALRLKRSGREVFIASNFGHEGSIAEWRGMKVLPRGFDMYSNDVVAAYWELACHEAGEEAIAITLFDVWVFQGPSWDRIPRVLSWVPIDHAPVPKKVADWLSKDNVTPVAMSQFGASELEKAGIDHRYAPHALERTFHPTKHVERPNGERITGRELLGFDEGDFVIFMNSANKGVAPARKSWDTNFMAVSIFMEDHPDARLYLHTERDGAMGGVHLPALLSSVGIPPEKVRFTEPFSYRMGLPQEALAAMNTAADVVLTASLGEGFGIPTIEAQACGTRVITSSWSASRELVGDGWTVLGQPSWDAMQSAWWMVPNVGSTVDALVESYNAPRGRSDKAVKFAADYEADHVFKAHWTPILGEFE